jgi:hypothetical protein
MPIEPRDILETFFETGDIPTADQFKDLLDSYIHQTDDGVTVYHTPTVPPTLHFGIGVQNPQSRLGVRALDDASRSAIALYDIGALNAGWYLSLKPENNQGLSLDEFTAAGNLSRLYIQQVTGNVGIGTTTPSQKLELKASTSAGITAVKLLNTATLNNGIFLGHKQSSSANENGAFSIYINSISPTTEYFTILENGKTGIGISDPDVRLHVFNDVALPTTDIDLIPGTGITVIGPMTNNIGIDYRGFQAREGTYTDPTDPTTLVLTASTLNLNRIDGDVLIHGDSANAVGVKMIFTHDGLLGVGTITPAQKVDIAGAVKIGTTATGNAGTIRFTGSDFEGFINSSWVSLTAGMGPWATGTPAGTIYYKNGTTSRIAVGATTAAASLDINDAESVTTGNIAAIIHNHSQTTSSVVDDHRIGIEIINDGTWGGTPQSKNMGLFVSATGHTPLEANIGIVSSGNVLIGDLVSGQQAFGTGAKNTLAIRSSAVPGTSPDTDTIQIFSALIPSVSGSVFNVKLGNNDVVKLYKGAALPAKNTNPVSDTYTSVEAGVLNDIRNRLDALETFLQNLGLLA